MSALSDLLFTNVPATLYLAAFHEDPAHVTDPVTVEAIAPYYSRPEVVWTRSGDALTFASPSLFQGVQPGSRIVALGLWDRHTNGRLRFSWPIPPKHFTKGGTLQVESISLAIPA